MERAQHPLVLRDNTASFPRRRESMVAILVLHDNTASFPRRRESMVAVLVLHDNTASFPRRRESMVAVLVLHDNTASFPRRRESIKYDTCFVGWAKRSVPNTQMLPFPRFVRLLVRIAKLPSPMFRRPVFQVAGHVCVERSLGFVGHDVERGLFHDGCTVMDSRLRGNDGGGPRRRESMVAVLVLHDNTESFPRRRESIKYDTSFVGWAKRSVPNTQMLPFPRFVKLLVRIAKLPTPSPHIRFFRLLVTFV